MRLIKKIAVLLALTMILMVLGGCLPKISIPGNLTGDNGETTDENNPDNGNGDTDNGDSDTTESYGEGQELTAFIDGYLAVKKPLYDNLAESFNTDTDYLAYGQLIGMSASDLTIIYAEMFDSVEILGGVFMFGDIDNAYKRIKGDIIEFGYDYTYKEGNSGGLTAGSRSAWIGFYNMAKGSIKFEMIDDKGADGYSRTIIEINKIGDKKYISQILAYSEYSYSDPDSNPATGIFTLIDGENIWSISGEQAGSRTFSYKSIYEQNVTKIEDLTGGFTIKTTASFVDGKSSYKAAEE